MSERNNENFLPETGPMFAVGERVIHFTGMLYGKVVGYDDREGCTHVVVQHEDPYYKDEDDGLTLWSPHVLRRMKKRGA